MYMNSRAYLHLRHIRRNWRTDSPFVSLLVCHNLQNSLIKFCARNKHFLIKFFCLSHLQIFSNEYHNTIFSLLGLQSILFIPKLETPQPVP
jgi:hypothetical protein